MQQIADRPFLLPASPFKAGGGRAMKILLDAIQFAIARSIP